MRPTLFLHLSPVGRGRPAASASASGRPGEGRQTFRPRSIPLTRSGFALATSPRRGEVSRNTGTVVNILKVKLLPLVPAKTGIQRSRLRARGFWVPASAGTNGDERSCSGVAQ
jgi:hypothetical protein